MNKWFDMIWIKWIMYELKYVVSFAEIDINLFQNQHILIKQIKKKKQKMVKIIYWINVLLCNEQNEWYIN